MNVFEKSVRTQAETAIHQIWRESPIQGTDPILQLIGLALEDGAGGIESPPKVPVSSQEWLTWQGLLLQNQDKVLGSVNQLLQREQISIPSSREAIREWAAQIVLSVMDELEIS